MTWPPDSTACVRAWGELLDLGVEMALSNLMHLGQSREQAQATLKTWSDQDNRERWVALQNMVRGDRVNGE